MVRKSCESARAWANSATDSAVGGTWHRACWMGQLLGFYVGSAPLRSRPRMDPNAIEARGPRAGWLAGEEALEGTRPKARRMIEQ